MVAIAHAERHFCAIRINNEVEEGEEEEDVRVCV